MPGTHLRGTRPGLPGYLALTAILGLAAHGCGFFDLREPVAPDVPNVQVPFQEPVGPDNVLFNFMQAVRYKQNGASQYEESLADAFTLVLDELDALSLGVDSLSRAQDIEAQRRLNQAFADSFYFEFGEVVAEISGTTAFYEDIPYELLFIGPAGDTSRTVRGKARLDLAEVEASQWALTRWEDQPADTSDTFGFLHGERSTGF